MIYFSSSTKPFFTIALNDNNCNFTTHWMLKGIISVQRDMNACKLKA